MNENPTIAEPLDPAPGGVGTAATSPSRRSPASPLQPRCARRCAAAVTDRVLSGVCGGIGRQYDVDPVLLRILVVVATVFTGGALAIGLRRRLGPDPGRARLPPRRSRPRRPAPCRRRTPPAAPAPTSTRPPVRSTAPRSCTSAAPRRTEPRSLPRPHHALGRGDRRRSARGPRRLRRLACPRSSWPPRCSRVLGIGLLVGAFRGRARWLIAPAVILLLVAQVAAARPEGRERHGRLGRRRPPLDADDEQPRAYELGAGSATLDLSKLPAGPVDGRRDHRRRRAHRARPGRHAPGPRRQRRGRRDRPSRIARRSRAATSTCSAPSSR